MSFTVKNEWYKECGKETGDYKTIHSIYLNTVFELIVVVWAIFKQ
jgi:hypothetical protein